MIDLNTLMGDGSGLAIQTVLGILSPFFIQWWKRSPLPWFNRHAGALNSLLSGAIAVATTVGVGIDWTPLEEGGGALTLTLPAWAAMVRAVLQFGLHELIYRARIKPQTLIQPTRPPDNPSKS